MSFLKKNNYLIYVSILTGLYFLFLVGIVFFANKYAIFILPAFLVIPLFFLRYKFTINNYFLLYIITTPFIQHFSFNGAYIGDFVITPHMGLQLILFILVLIKYFSEFDQSSKHPFGSIDKLMVVLILCSILSLFFGYALPENDVKRWLLFYTGILETTSIYFITIFLLRDDRELIKEILVAFMISVFFSGIIAYSELSILGFNFVKIFLARMRYGFGFHNTNLFGIYSALIFPLIVYLIYNHKSKSIRIISILSFSLLTLLSVFCFNRGTFITLTLQIILLLFYTKNKKLILSFLGVIVASAIYFSNLLLFYTFRFVGNQNQQGLDLSALYRLEAWRIALQGLLLYPFGVGAGGFQLLWIKYSYKPQIYLGTPHQLFLSIGIDYGIMTMVTFILILCFSFYFCSKLTKSGSPNSSLFKYIIISIVGFVVYGMVTDGELSHLSGFIAPNNGYTIILFTIIGVISFSYSIIFNDDKE